MNKEYQIITERPVDADTANRFEELFEASALPDEKWILIDAEGRAVKERRGSEHKVW